MIIFRAAGSLTLVVFRDGEVALTQTGWFQEDEYAGNLYEDVGEVAMTLIGLRLKQAEEAINKLPGR